MNRSFYSSKLLLFGEYTIIKGSKALAMPFSTFGGQWAFASEAEPAREERSGLLELLTYLQEQQQAGLLDYTLSLDRFQADVKRGLYFHSTIPIGFGLGSSGALSAAVYDRFYEGAEEKNWWILKQRLAQIEACFHGSSSGIDPLICLLNQAILLQSKTEMEAVQIPAKTKQEGTVFLLNTQMPRKTAPLVNIFEQRCEEKYYNLRCQTDWAPLTDDAISAFLNANWPLLLECIHEIGHFQYRYFDAMIPEAFRPIWLDGLSSDLYKLKLCGAGGGGFILGFTQNWPATQATLHEYELTSIF